MAALRLERMWDVQDRRSPRADRKEIPNHPGALGTSEPWKHSTARSGFPLYRRYEITHERSMMRSWIHYNRIIGNNSPLPFRTYQRPQL